MAASPPARRDPSGKVGSDWAARPGRLRLWCLCALTVIGVWSRAWLWADPRREVTHRAGKQATRHAAACRQRGVPSNGSVGAEWAGYAAG